MRDKSKGGEAKEPYLRITDVFRYWHEHSTARLGSSGMTNWQDIVIPEAPKGPVTPRPKDVTGEIMKLWEAIRELDLRTEELRRLQGGEG